MTSPCPTRTPPKKTKRFKRSSTNAREKPKKSGTYKTFKVTPAQVREIAQRKIQDLNARDVDHAARIVAGTARSMGIEVEG